MVVNDALGTRADGTIVRLTAAFSERDNRRAVRRSLDRFRRTRPSGRYAAAAGSGDEPPDRFLRMT